MHSKLHVVHTAFSCDALDCTARGTNCLQRTVFFCLRDKWTRLPKFEADPVSDWGQTCVTQFAPAEFCLSFSITTSPSLVSVIHLNLRLYAGRVWQRYSKTCSEVKCPHRWYYTLKSHLQWYRIGHCTVCDQIMIHRMESQCWQSHYIKLWYFASLRKCIINSKQIVLNVSVSWHHIYSMGTHLKLNFTQSMLNFFFKYQITNLIVSSNSYPFDVGSCTQVPIFSVLHFLCPASRAICLHVLVVSHSAATARMPLED